MVCLGRHNPRADPRGGLKSKDLQIKMRWVVARLKEMKENICVSGYFITQDPGKPDLKAKAT